jgi:hypothetical protein
MNVFPSTQFSQAALKNSLCTDITARSANIANNCTTVSIDNFQTFNTMVYWLYRLTIGIKYFQIFFY